MKKHLRVSLLVWFATASYIAQLDATSYCYISSGGDSTIASIIQGQALDIEADCETGGILFMGIYKDTDSSLTLTNGDICIGIAKIADGDILWPEGLRDAVSGADGRIKISIPMVWLESGSWIIAAYENDLFIASDQVTILPHPSPPAVLSGNIVVSGITPPNPMLAGIAIVIQLIAAVGVTDETGAFCIELPFGGFTSKIEVYDSKAYLLGPGSFDFNIPAGGMSGIPLMMTIPPACVFGNVSYSSGESLDFNAVLRANLMDGTPKQRTVTNSYYFMGVPAGDSILVELNQNSNPGCLFPYRTSDAFVAHSGDTIEKNITVFQSDGYIYGHLNIADELYDRAYSFFSEAASYRAEVFNNTATGEILFPVSSEIADSFDVYFNIWDEGFSIPDGYIIYPRRMKAAAGDHVEFYILSEAEANATLAGRVTDQFLEPLPGELEIRLTNTADGTVHRDTTISGYFEFWVNPGHYRVSSSYDMLDFDPPYLYPNYGTSYFEFELDIRDTQEFNFPCYKANDSIFIHIDELGGPGSRRYKFRAPHVVMGTMIRHSDTISQILVIPVANDYPQPYNVYLATTDTPIPEGRYTEGPPRWDLLPGDTAFLRIKPYPIYISGIIYQDPDDPLIRNFHRFIVTTYNLSDSSIFDTTKVRLDRNFYQSVPNGEYFLKLKHDPEYLFKPYIWDTVTVPGTGIYNVAFTANSRACTLTVNLVGIPIDSIHSFVFEGFGDLPFPLGYYVNSEQPAGTASFAILVCDAEWRFMAPMISGYVVEPIDTIIIINDLIRALSIDFRYTPVSVNENQKPDEFILFTNVPNPFNSTTRIYFSKHTKGDIRLDIFDIEGRLVRTFVLGDRSAGRCFVDWNGSDDAGRVCPSGVYFMVLTQADKSEMGKILLLR